jgi:hypothetical protein
LFFFIKLFSDDAKIILMATSVFFASQSYLSFQFLFNVLLFLLLSTPRISSNFLGTYSFSCTRVMQNVTVPSLASYMRVDMSGAAGGPGDAGIPGYAARVQTIFSVVPESLLHVVVGCQGTRPTGGFNGGGNVFNTGSGGGGASDIRIGGIGLTNRIVTAGGGGGIFAGSGCGPQKGGNGGKYGAAGTSPNSCSTQNGLPSGQGGTWTGGGAKGTPVSGGSCSAGNIDPQDGQLGRGGTGGCENSGGGGGGYYGGDPSFNVIFVLLYYMMFSFLFRWRRRRRRWCRRW